MKRASTLLALATLGPLGITPALAAPALPDAGQTLRELQPSLPATAPGALPAAPRSTAPATEEANAARVDVQRFVIIGNREISDAALHALIDDLAGAARSLAELNAAASRITAYYRERGYAVARAYLPAQDIVDGTVTINVIEGRIAGHRLDNRSRLTDARAGAYLDHVRDGDVIRTDDIDRSLLLLGDTPGISGSRATLQPGASVGSSELLVELTPGPAISGNAGIDNFGNRYTGEYRASATVNANSPLGIGDQFSASALTSGEHLNYGRLAYQLPLGSNGWRVGAAYFAAHYNLGREFAQLDAHGDARSASMFASYPLIRSQQTNLSAIATLEHKNLSDQIDSTATRTDKRLRLINLGLSGSRRDDLNGGGIISLDLALVHGKLSIDSPGAMAIDAASARSNGSYTRLSYTLARLQRVTDNNMLWLQLSGQRAGRNLDSSEKFALGGINGVRAYPQGEGIGDEGYLATLELRHNLSPQWQATLFYDTGEITVNHDRYDLVAANGRRLAGVGAGLNAGIGPVQLRAALAWRTDGGNPTSVPASAAHTPTFWLQLGTTF